jgi:sporulation protein YqfC
LQASLQLLIYISNTFKFCQLNKEYFAILIIYIIIGDFMGFGDCILRCLNLEDCTLLSSFRLTVIGSKGVYIEGAVRIVDVTSDFVKIEIKGGVLKIDGVNLQITSYLEKDVAILGKIKKVEII